MEHTPTPWHMEKQFTGQKFTAIGEPIAVVGGETTGERVEFVIGRMCDFGPHGDSQTQANAEFIVRAVNSHDELLRGCQAALAYLADPPSVFPENRDAAVEIIRAAIAKATGNA